MKKFPKALLIAAWLGLAFLILTGNESIALPAHASSPWYVAPGGSDSNDCLSGVTACATINGAIGKASSGDTINVAIGTYTGTGTEVVLVDRNVNLSGGWDSAFTTQSGTATVDGQSARTGVSIPNGSGVVARVDRFVVQHGLAGIFNGGTLDLNNSVVQNNSVGGVSSTAILTVTNSMIANNTSTTFAGGLSSFIVGNTFISNTVFFSNTNGAISNNGAMTITNGTFISNTATYGGAIWQGGVLTMNNSTFTGNNAYLGGALYNYAYGGPTIVNNSTFSGNLDGSGIHNAGGYLYLNNSTVTENNASYGAGGVDVAYGVVELRNSIVAGNSNQTNPDCRNYSGAITSKGYNLIGNTTGCSFSADTGDLVNVAPILGPLQNNGGSTMTRALFPGSPAIDNGNLSGCNDNQGNPLSTDQRGMARVGRCDIGAFEYQGVVLRTFLPLINKPAPPLGIYGHVTFNGSSALGMFLELRFWNGSSYSTQASTTTDGSGNYHFLSAPTLNGGQSYYVRYSNGSDSSKLYFWGTRSISSYIAGTNVAIGDFDLANIPLVSPSNGATVSLPQTFQWTPRSATTSDSYEFDLYTPSNLTNGTPSWWTIPLGYVGSYTLNNLPSGFSTGTPYGWYAAVYSPDGGYGESFYYRSVTFSNTGFGPALRSPSSPSLNKREAPYPKKVQ